MGAISPAAQLLVLGGSRYVRLRNAAIAAARRNDASLWFAGAPADLAGFVWQDSAGTTPATGTDPIGRLVGRAGSNAATQATAANKPTLELQANGYYGMRFDGSNDELLVSGIAAASSVSYIVSARKQTIATFDGMVGRRDGPAVSGLYLFAEATTGKNQIQIGDGSNYSFLGNSPVAELVPYVFTSTVGASTVTTRLNGTLDINQSYTSFVEPSTDISIGGIDPFVGTMSLICRASVVLPDADRIAIERFAALLSGATYA